jgi:hypothetical protein
VVNNFMLDAGRKYLSAFNSNSVSPVCASAISRPHSPLLGGGAVSSTSARAENRRAAAAACELSLFSFAEQHAPLA